MKTSAVRLLTAFLFVVALLPPGQADAQQTATGTITGQVIDDATQQPLAGAAVVVVGTPLGTVTNTDGRFLIPRVPVGSHQVQVSLIGHGEATQTVNVVLDQTATVNFALSATAIALEQVVVTGTVGATRRAKLPIVVDQVRAEDLPVPAVTAGSVIQGKVAGATVVSGSGRPGAAPTILLRGPTSINAAGRSQEPLYIVDGVILTASMVDFDALDIESVEVVKGAAGASLYGSRAQAGVVQIRTRRGTGIPTDQIRYTVRSEFGQNMLGETPSDLFSRTHQYEVDGTQFVRGTTRCDIMLCTGTPNYAGQRAGPDEAATVWNSFMIEPYPGRTYDQIDRFFRDGNFMQNYVSAEGRAGSTNFNASYSNLRDQGIMRGHDGFNRHNFRLNLDQSIRPEFQVSASAFYSRSTQNAFPEQNGNPMFNLTRMPAGVNLFACEDDVTQECINSPMNLRLLTDVFSREASNPLYDLLNRKYVEERGRFLGSANLRYSPLSWLNLDATVSYDRLDLLEDEHYPKGFRTISPTPSLNEGLIYKYNERQEGLNGSLTATGTFQLGENITNRTQLRYLIEDREEQWSWTQGDQLRVGHIYTFGNADNTRISANSLTEIERADGYFAITNFDIYDRYIIDALVRNDGSSLFGENERRQWYYRLAGAWRVGEEPWFNLPFIDELKLRYSYGTAGGRPRFSAQYETYSVSSSGVTPITLGNKDLKPEFTREHEAGFDAALWNNRITAALTYANSKTTDQILLVPLAAYNGFGDQWRNAGTLQSSTWEASLDARLLQTQNLTWTAGIMYDRTRQEITELNVPPYTHGVTGQGLGAVFYARPGEALGTFYGVQVATQCSHLPVGVDCNLFQVNDDGFLVYVGAGGSLDNPQWGTQAPADVTIRGVRPTWGVPLVGECEDRISGNRTTFCPLGQGLPDYKMSFRSSVNWKGLSVYGLVDSWQGFNVYNQPLQWTIFKQLGGIMDQTGVPEARQKPVGYYDHLYAVSGLAPSSAFVEDGSFIKLREVSVRYRIDGSTLASVPALNAFDGITLSLIGRNLYTWTDYRGYDPEVGRGGSETGSAALARVEGYQYPPFRTWTFSVDLNF